jgi:hypothetical protein
MRVRETAAVEKNDVDEILCDLQGASEKAEFAGFGSLPVWVGVAECRTESRAGHSVPRASRKVRLRRNDAYVLEAGVHFTTRSVPEFRPDFHRNIAIELIDPVVISVTAPRRKLRCNAPHPFRLGCSMSEPLSDVDSRLGQLIQQIMKETDRARYDDLGDEIWRVLSERERVVNNPSPTNRPVNALAARCEKQLIS